MIRIVFFAALREQLGCSEFSLATETPCTVADIQRQLEAESEQWQQVLQQSSWLTAVNHQMVNSEHPVQANDEVAFFPPVTGG